MRNLLIVSILLACAGAWAQPALGPYVTPTAQWITSGSLIVGLEASTNTVAAHQAASGACLVWTWDRDAQRCPVGFDATVNSATNVTTAQKTVIHDRLTSAPSRGWADWWNAVPGTPGSNNAIRNYVQRTMIKAAVRCLSIEIDRMQLQVNEMKKWRTLMWDYSTSASIVIP